MPRQQKVVGEASRREQGLVAGVEQVGEDPRRQARGRGVERWVKRGTATREAARRQGGQPRWRGKRGEATRWCPTEHSEVEMLRGRRRAGCAETAWAEGVRAAAVAPPHGALLEAPAVGEEEEAEDEAEAEGRQEQEGRPSGDLLRNGRVRSGVLVNTAYSHQKKTQCIGHFLQFSSLFCAQPACFPDARMPQPWWFVAAPSPSHPLLRQQTSATKCGRVRRQIVGRCQEGGKTSRVLHSQRRKKARHGKGGCQGDGIIRENGREEPTWKRDRSSGRQPKEKRVACRAYR